MTTLTERLGGRDLTGAVRRIAIRVGFAALAIVVVKVALVILDNHGVVEASTPLPVVVLGAIIGMTYGLLAVGLVLIYRTNRIINFAHGQIGAFAAAFFGVAVVKWHFPYWVGFPIALGVAGLTGAAAETGVVRRLRNAPRIMSVVATLGVGQFLVVFAAVINSTASAGSLYPEPPFLPSFNIGALRVTPEYFGMLLLSPIVVVAIAVFLKRSKFGLGMRAAAANPEAARMAGIFAGRMSSLAWAIAGALSAFSAILTQPTQGFTGADAFGPSLLLRAMTGAVIARMQSLPVALAAGVGLGIVEQVLLWNYPSSGLVEVTLFAIILGVLMLQRQRGGRDEEKGSWAAVQALRPVPEALQRIWLVRNLGLIVGVVSIGFLALVPALVTNSLSVSFTGMMAFAVVGISIGILTGLGGQLTLGQFAIAAIGAVTSYEVSKRIGDFPLALLYAGLAGGIVSVVIGLPALRIRGLMLTVTTLSFALATPAWLLAQPWMLGEGHDPGRPIVFGNPLDTGHEYYYFGLTIFVIALVLARNVRRSGFGRLLVAIRDNEDNARAFAVRASLVKMQCYLIAGFIAGLGGAMYGHSLSNIGVSTFPASMSVTVAVLTVLGGVSALTGPILGVLYIFGLPLAWKFGNAGLAVSNFGVLLFILWKPAGIIQLVDPVRIRVIATIARLRGVDPSAFLDPSVDVVTAAATAERATVTEPAGRLVVPAQSRQPSAGTVLLEARALSKRFGGVLAVDDVSLRVHAGEVLGMIGPNGAGKTTTFEMLGGFTRPDRGRVLFNRRDISHLGPEDRAHLGLIRSFQDAALFPTMTVKETVMLALERTRPTRFLSSVAGWTIPERAKERRARELVALMGLDAYRDKQVQELSTGTRRIAEIACLVAVEPTLLLLDEPSSGIAQRESEALGTLLLDLRRDLGITLVVIEHDIPLIMGISDRIVAMADGHVIATGTPDEVRADPVVVDAYLGGSVTAIERSGATPAGVGS